MADNSKYQVGTDIYEGNDISSWQALSQSFKYLYVRASIGAVNDSKFVQYIQAGKSVGMLVGAYAEQWPGTPIDWQVSTLQQQIAKSGIQMDLPSAIAFEQQYVLDTKSKRYLPTFPGAGEFNSFYQKLKALMPTCGYIGLAGLSFLKSGGLNLNTYDWWLARYYWSQGLMGEMSVDDTVSYVLSTYGITKDNILFIQTADALPYPDKSISPDKGCDYDRAVSFSVVAQPPAPQPIVISPNSDIEITVQSNSEVDLASVMVDGNDVTNLSKVTVVPIPVPIPQPTPVPPPAPTSKANRYRILYDFEMPAKYYNGQSRTASPTWTGNPITPATARINGVKTGYKLTDKEVQAVTKINAPYPTALKYVSAHQGGWVNYGYWPSVETLTFEGNIVDVISIDQVKNRAYIRVWNGEDGSGVDDDCVIHHWTNIGSKNQIYTGSWKGPAFIILAYETGAWIELDKLVKV